MSRSLVAISVLLVALPVAAARSEPFSGAQLQAVAAGGEFRGFIQTQRGFENHVWRFSPGGGLTGVASSSRSPGGLGFSEEFGDRGSWRVDGSRLCVEWHGLNRQFSGCYVVDGSPDSSQVRLIGPTTWQGTLAR